MDWLTQNWIWIAVTGGVLAVYFFGPRGRGTHAGGHGGCCGGAGEKKRRVSDTEATDGHGGETGAMRAGRTSGGQVH